VERSVRRRGVGEPPRRIALDRAREPVVEAVGQRPTAELCRAPRGGRERLEQALAHDALERPSLLRASPIHDARERAEHDEPKRPHVRGRGDGAVELGLLGRHPHGRPHRGRPRRLGLREDLRDTEVEHLHGELHAGAARRAHQDVLRLDVSVDDAGRVRRPERVAELREQLVDLGRRHRAAPLEEDREGLALEQLHHEEGRAARTVEARRDDLDDVLALDTRAHPSLLHEPLAELVVAHEVLVHELEDTLATRAQLRDDVDGPHAAGGELVVDLIVGRDDRPGREHGGEEDSPLSRASPTSAWRSRSSSRRARPSRTPTSSRAPGG
jgi:hypothetical protein